MRSLRQKQARKKAKQQEEKTTLTMMTTNHFPSVSFVFDEWKKIADVIYTLGIVSVLVYLHAEHSRQNAYLSRVFFLRVPLWAEVKLNHNNIRPGRNDSHGHEKKKKNVKKKHNNISGSKPLLVTNWICGMLFLFCSIIFISLFVGIHHFLSFN